MVTYAPNFLKLLSIKPKTEALLIKKRVIALIKRELMIKAIVKKVNTNSCDRKFDLTYGTGS